MTQHLDGVVIYNPGDFQRYLKGHAYRGVPVADRIFKFVEKTDTCWLWTGAQTKFGYGIVKNANGSQLAHRVMYELLVGPIPDGLQLDHLCRVTGCVNPQHLEPVTGAENIRRKFAALAEKRRTVV